MLLAVSICFWRNAPFATMRRTRVFAASRLLQEVAEAGGWLQLYCRLDYFFRMTSTGAVAVLLVVTAAVMSVPMRLVLLRFR